MRGYRLLLPLLLLLATIGYTQESDIIKDESLLKKYLSQEKFDIDTSARAVVLYEKGASYTHSGTIMYRIERVIKIIHQDAANDLSKVNIPYGSDYWVRKVSGITFNLENGVITRQEVESNDMLKDKVTKDLTVSKFNLPSVKAGSIIYYTYTVEHPGFLQVRDWNFQSEYPTLYSEYDVTFPGIISFTVLERVNVPMFATTNKKDLATCEACSYDESSTTLNTRIWVRRNIPAIKREPLMSSVDNYTERVKLHVKSVNVEGVITKIYNNWDDFSREYIYTNESLCGQVFRGNNFLGEKVKELTGDKKTALEKAKAIYSYVQRNYEEQSGEGNNIREIFNSHTGSGIGINLLLSAMLRKADLKSAPLILSTRGQERLNNLYPAPDLINYMVSTAVIDGRTYYLDASEKNLPFGTLVPECYNGYCRIIDENGRSTILHPDSLLNKTTIVVDIAPSTDTSAALVLKVDEQFGTFTAFYLRNKWRKDSSEIRKEINKELEGTLTKTQLRTFSIKNLEDPELPLLLHYEAFTDLKRDVDLIYFDPYFAKFFDNNPFSATSRKYPVEMDYKQDINYMFHLRLPEGYAVDDYPKSTTTQFSNPALITMKNLMGYEESNKTFSLNSRFTTKTTVFNAEEYDELRSFYENVINEQNKKLVLKKLN